jgi:hypothetical protein
MTDTALDRWRETMREACKDGMKPSPCVGCKKITPLYLRSSVLGPIPYCQECLSAELEASHRKLLREAKAAGFKTVEAWQDWQEASSIAANQRLAEAAGFETIKAWVEASMLPKGDWE